MPFHPGMRVIPCAKTFWTGLLIYRRDCITVYLTRGVLPQRTRISFPGPRFIEQQRQGSLKALGRSVMAWCRAYALEAIAEAGESMLPCEWKRSLPHRAFAFIAGLSAADVGRSPEPCQESPRSASTTLGSHARDCVECAFGLVGMV